MKFSDILLSPENRRVRHAWMAWHRAQGSADIRAAFRRVRYFQSQSMRRFNLWIQNPANGPGKGR